MFLNIFFKTLCVFNIVFKQILTPLSVKIFVLNIFLNTFEPSSQFNKGIHYKAHLCNPSNEIMDRSILVCFSSPLHTMHSVALTAVVLAGWQWLNRKASWTASSLIKLTYTISCAQLVTSVESSSWMEKEGCRGISSSAKHLDGFLL